MQWDSWRRDDGTWEVMLVYRVAGEPHSASWTYDPPRRLVQAVDDEARSLIGESDDLAMPEPSFPFVPRIARLPRERSMDRALDRSDRERPGLPAPSAEPAEESTGERDSLTSLLEAVPSFRGDLVVPERPAEPAEEPDDEPAAEEPPAPAASAGSAYADVLMPRSVGSHRDRLIGATDRQAEADGVRPGRRACRPELGRDRVRHPSQEAGVGLRAGTEAVVRTGTEEGARVRAPLPAAPLLRIRPRRHRPGRIRGPLGPGTGRTGPPECPPPPARGPRGRPRRPSRSTRPPRCPRTPPRAVKRSLKLRRGQEPAVRAHVLRRRRRHRARDVPADPVDRLHLPPRVPLPPRARPAAHPCGPGPRPRRRPATPRPPAPGRKSPSAGTASSVDSAPRQDGNPPSRTRTSG